VQRFHAPNQIPTLKPKEGSDSTAGMGIKDILDISRQGQKLRVLLNRAVYGPNQRNCTPYGMTALECNWIG
jgi:hypothetical protein